MTDAREKFAPNAEVYGADYYERMYRPHWLLRNRRKYRERDAALLRIVRPSPSARVLEVGSARGDTAFFLAPRVAEVVGIDAAPAAVEAARAEKAARGVRERALRGGRRARPRARLRADRSTSSSSRISSSTSSTTCSSRASRARGSR